MAFADCVQELSATVGTDPFLLAGVVVGGAYRTWSSKHAAGEKIRYHAEKGAQWEVGIGTLVDGTHISRDVILSSSNNDLIVPFLDGTMAISEVLSAYDILRFAGLDNDVVTTVSDTSKVNVFIDDGSAKSKKISLSNFSKILQSAGGSAVRDLPFSPDANGTVLVPLDMAGESYMAAGQVTKALTFTLGPNPVRGAKLYQALTANGVNEPNTSAFKKTNGSSDYVNVAGTVNYLQFFHDGTNARFYVDQDYGVAPPASADTTPPTLSSPTSASTGTTTGSASVTTNEANGTLYYIATMNATETAATVKAGASVAVTSTGSKAVGFTGLAAATQYYPHFLHRDAAGNDSAVMNAPAFTTAAATGDTTAPTISSPTGTQTGSNTATGTVSTNEANGTLYYLASQNAVESAATIKAAQSQPVTASGVQNVSFTGLTAATQYYPHFVHRDAAGNDSTVANGAAFTTAATAPASPPANGWPQLTSLAQMTQSGTGPYDYAGTGGDLNSANGGLTAKSLPANTDGYIDFIITSDPSEVIVGFNIASSLTTYGNLRFSLYAPGGTGNAPTAYRSIAVSHGAAANAAGLAVQPGDTLRVWRQGTVLKSYVARAATPTTFVQLDSYDNGTAPQMWVQFIATTTSTVRIINWSGFV